MKLALPGIALLFAALLQPASAQEPSTEVRVASISFGKFTIPPTPIIDAEARDRAESEFLALREEEMPRQLTNYMAQEDPRGPARDQDVAVLKTSQLEAVVGNNRSLESSRVKHNAGYNGLFSITTKEQTESPFVPAYAGWNLEHYFDALPRPGREVFFEPRFAEMKLTRVDDRTVELHQPATPVFQVESWTRFTAVEPDAIDFDFRCQPHRDDYAGDFLGVFWASYINGPINKSMYFLDAKSTLEKPVWRQLCTQQHNRDSTVKNADDTTELKFQQQGTLFASISPLRYSAPFFYGRFREMVLIYVFRPNSNLRFTHSPSGGGSTPDGTDTNPAWDFQLIIPKPVKGHQYGLEGRLIYKKWQGRDDVLTEVNKFIDATSSAAAKEPSRN